MSTREVRRQGSRVCDKCHLDILTRVADSGGSKATPLPNPTHEVPHVCCILLSHEPERLSVLGGRRLCWFSFLLTVNLAHPWWHSYGGGRWHCGRRALVAG